MKKTESDLEKYVFMSSFLLPNGMLDFFDIVKVDEEASPKEIVYTGGILNIYLDELDNRTEAQQSLRPNGSRTDHYHRSKRLFQNAFQTEIHYQNC